MNSTPDIRVDPAPGVTIFSQVTEVFAAAFFIIHPHLIGAPREWKVWIVLASVFIGVVSLSFAWIKLSQTRQIWRFEDDGAVLMTGRREQKISAQGLVLLPHRLTFFAWAQYPDGTKRRIPLPSSDSGGQTAFLMEMRLRGAEILFSEWLASPDPPERESLRARLRNSPLQFADMGAALVIVAAVTAILIGWGLGRVLFGIVAAAVLLGFTLMLYPKAFQMVKPRASEKPLNDLLHDLSFDGEHVQLVLTGGGAWEADLGEAELVIQERRALSGYVEHRLVIRGQEGTEQPLTPWETSPQESTGWIRSAFLKRGVELKREVKDHD